MRYCNRIVPETNRSKSENQYQDRQCAQELGNAQAGVPPEPRPVSVAVARGIAL